MIDFLVFRSLSVSGISFLWSQIAGFFSGAILIIELSAGTRLPIRDRYGWRARRIFYGKFLLISTLVLFLRSAFLLLLTENWQWQPQAAIVATIPISTTVFILGIVLYLFPQSVLEDAAAIRWPLVTVGVLTYVLILKLIYMGVLDVIPEEAYYWNYAQHLDYGYLDHPPMVGWLIWLSTTLFGKSEFSVRLPAYLSWLIVASFMFRLSLNLYDNGVAFRTLILLAVLPIYFGLGFFMTPDASLVAAWAGCLYFLQRALIAQERKAWWGVGVCLGLGMLSKYTIALLGVGTLVFLVIDRKSRSWLLRPEPYVAAIVSMLLFSPVLLWNLQHEWVSFGFQTSDRWAGSHNFSLHVLIGWILLLLTPMGLFDIVRVLLPEKWNGAALSGTTNNEKQKYLWALIFTLVPLSVFVIYSLLYQPKFNWTAPVWLAAIPLLAWDMVPHGGEVRGWLPRLTRRMWMPTIVALLLIHGGSFYYIARGLPGAGPMTGERLFGEWRLLADGVKSVKRDVEAKTGSQPVIIGLDKNFISSELTFYDAVDNKVAANTGGAHFFGKESLMWAFWYPRSAALGRNFLMVDFKRKSLANPLLPQYFETLGEIAQESLIKDGRVVGYFYWRIGYRYRG